jgi:hypothetical protein
LSSPLSSRGPEPPLPRGTDAPWWAAELAAARREQLLDQSADWVVRKQLEAPVLMFLEMHKPLTTLASVAYAMGQPPLMLFFGFRRTEDLRLLLSERGNVEALMQRIELRSRAKGSAT